MDIANQTKRPKFMFKKNFTHRFFKKPLQKAENLVVENSETKTPKTPEPEVKVENESTTEHSENGFLNMGLCPTLIKALDKKNFTTPTPIQKSAIPVAVKGKDVVGVAQTGTGKTLAFSLPIMERLLNLPGKKALIVLPTRELAMQVEETLKKFMPQMNMRSALLIGGVPKGRQIRDIHRNPHIIIGTPGRIIDHLNDKILHLKNLEILVLDEADRMLDMGFAPQLNQILRNAPKERQTMLFSATMPDEIAKIAATFMQNPQRIEVSRPGQVVEKIRQELLYVAREKKNQVLEKILKKYSGTVLVFSRTKHGARKICKSIKFMGYSTAEIHSNKSLSQRIEALEGFKKGKYRILVATDIASRGIDVNNIELIVNYDIPENAEDYVHRIGRTARAGKMGRAISIASPDQKKKVASIERLTKMRIPLINAIN